MPTEANFLDAIVQDIVAGEDESIPTLIYADFLEKRLNMTLPGSEMTYSDLAEIIRTNGDLRQSCSAPVWEQNKDFIDGWRNHLNHLLPPGGRDISDTESRSPCQVRYKPDKDSLLPRLWICNYRKIDDDYIDYVENKVMSALENYPFHVLQLYRSPELLPILLDSATKEIEDNPHRIRSAKEALAHLTTLDLIDIAIPGMQAANVETLNLLGNSEVLPNLRHLDLRVSLRIPPLLEALNSGPLYKQLHSLSLRGILHHEQWPHSPDKPLELPQLRKLDLSNNSLGDLQLAHLLRPMSHAEKQDNLPQLETLNVSYNRLEDLTHCLFSGWKSLSHVKTLDVSHDQLGQLVNQRRIQNMQTLGTWSLQSLETLKLDDNWLDHSDLEDLQQCTNLKSLKSLSLDEPALTQSFALIGNYTQLPQLEHLKLGFVGKMRVHQPAGILQPIADWQHFPQLQHLELAPVQWDKEMRRRIPCEIDVTPLVQKLSDPQFDETYLPSLRKVSVPGGIQQAELDAALAARWERKRAAAEAVSGDAPDSAAVVGEVKKDAARGKHR